ncbi:MAG TPA: SpoIIE family protein phosphatase [Terracidiphilus sp.]|nr:SpoIIE family protein phosphatase [Terracidiphilus sp.]
MQRTTAMVAGVAAGLALAVAAQAQRPVTKVRAAGAVARHVAGRIAGNGPQESAAVRKGAAKAAEATAPPAVVVDATHIGSPMTLDKNWRVGVSANPAAALPGFDDSKWMLRNAGDSLDEISDQDPQHDQKAGAHAPGTVSLEQENHPWVWFRLHVKLAKGHGPVALLIALPVVQNATMAFGAGGQVVDVYANGRLIAPEGPHGSAAGRYQEISRIYDLNVPPETTDLTLVARTLYIPFGLTAYTNFFSSRTLRLGYPAELKNEQQLWAVHSLFEHLPALTVAMMLLVLAAFLLALYYTQRGHAEYLWLALHEGIQAPIAVIDLLGSFAWLDQLWYGAMLLELVVISAYLFFEFLIAFLSLERRWYIQLMRFTAPILAGVGPGLLLLGYHNALVIWLLIFIYVGSLGWMVMWTVFIFLTLILATIKRNFEAGLLLIPLVLTIVGLVEPILTGGMSDWGGHAYHSPLTIQAGMIPIHFASVADFIGMLAIVLIIFVRFLRIQHDQERVTSELAAARSVQELMIPQETLETPGYEVDSVYNPAAEVGGDFYYVQPVDDGNLLVVLGDVAGKGLQAAMTVSMLMGALRQTKERSPARILESLNRVLTGGEGLTTCQAVWFGAQGDLVVASAGHLPPYLNSQEVMLPGGLPLGAIPEVTYEEVRLYLHPGDRLLLLSDGVVEAQQPTGELFGFDRVHNLSNQSAFYIADAAKSFGQEDDITVLTVRRVTEVEAVA